MSQPQYHGHHRASSPSSSRLPRVAGSGRLLPTAAAAALVLTASGAHLGTGTGDPASAATVAKATDAITSTDALDATGALDAAGALDALDALDALAMRSPEATDRVARDDDRERPDAIAQQNPRLAAEEELARQATPPATATPAAPAVPAVPVAAPAPPAAPDGRTWVAPINAAFALTSGFGMRWGSMHPGQDFAIPVGTPVRAMSSGTVVFAGWSGGYGYKVEIQYWDGTVSWYAHNSRLLVAQGRQVSPGDDVSLSGNTGHSTGPHLHLEIHPAGGSPVPPIPWLTSKSSMP